MKQRDYELNVISDDLDNVIDIKKVFDFSLFSQFLCRSAFEFKASFYTFSGE